MKYNRKSIWVFFVLSCFWVHSYIRAEEQPVIIIVPDHEEPRATEQITTAGGDSNNPWLAFLTDMTYSVVNFSDLKALAALSQSAAYTIDEEVILSGFYYHFIVRSKDARLYLVASTRKLMTLCHELNVIAALEGTEYGRQIITGLGQSLALTGKSAYNVVFHPGLSLKAIGERAARLGRSITKVGAEHPENELGRSKLGEGPAGAERRRFAYQIGVDVYTENPDLQAILSEVARQRLAGGLPVLALVPGSLILSTDMKPLDFDADIEELIVSNTPGELRRLLARRFSERFGFSPDAKNDPIGKLLANPNYSPRDLSMIWQSVSTLYEARGVVQIMEIVCQPDSPEQAVLYQEALEMLARLQLRDKNIVELGTLGYGFSARTDGNVIQIMLPFDIINNLEPQDEFFTIIYNIKTNHSGQLELWLTGDIDENLLEQLAIQGITVHSQAREILHLNYSIAARWESSD